MPDSKNKKKCYFHVPSFRPRIILLAENMMSHYIMENIGVWLLCKKNPAKKTVRIRKFKKFISTVIKSQ
jgi:hypothetical protein